MLPSMLWSIWFFKEVLLLASGLLTGADGRVVGHNVGLKPPV